LCQKPRDRKKSGIVLPVSTPYRPHSAYPGTPSSQPTGPKPRPSAAWFAVGGALLLVAAIFFGVSVGRLVHRLGHADAEFSGPGVHRVTLTPQVERAVFVQGRYRCQAVDGTGATVRFVRPDGSATYGSWHWLATFQTGDGNLTFRCHGAHGSTRITALPSIGMIFSTLLLGILIPLLLGGLGFVVLLVTAILWITRRPTVPPPTVPPPATWPPSA